MSDEADRVEQLIDQKLLLMAYSRLRMNVLLTMGVSVLFVGILWSRLPFPATAIWFSALMSVSALRLLHAEVFRRTKVRPEDWRWRRTFELGAVMGAAAWAIGPVLMLGDGGPGEAMLLGTTVLSVSAVASITMATQWRAMQAFLIFALGPTIAVLVSTGDPTRIIAGGVLLSAMIVLMIVGSVSSRSLRALLRTEIQLAESVEATRAAQQRAEEASLAKTRFLANMSHELRTPLNAVIGAAQLLRAQGDDPAARDVLVDQVQRSGLNLLGLIEGVLSLARIESGALVLNSSRFDLIETAEAALASVTLAAQSKDLKLACVIDPSLATHRQGDAEKVTQLLLNLLGNAVKFTPQGEVVMRLEPGESPSAVRISIVDSGIGISANDLPHVFEPFRQAEERSTRRYGGSGLGLTIARQLVLAMDGTLDVRSVPNEGSTFVTELSLPVVAGRTQDRPLAQPLGLEVWIIEPHEAGAQGLLSHLSRLGCTGRRMQVAGDLQLPGPGARIKLLVDDQSTTLMAAARALDPNSRCIDMVVMVSKLDGSIPGRLPDCPVLHRPITLRALTSCLQSDVGDTVPAALDLPTSTRPGQAHVLVVEDDPLNQAVVGGLLRHSGFDVVVVSSGQQALDLLVVQDFNAVLMDWQMPDMDGLEVVRRMRNGDAGTAAQNVPVIALTANAFAEDRDTCLRAGMNDFLTKPVLAAELMRTLNQWIGSHRSPSIAPTPGHQVQESAS